MEEVLYDSLFFGTRADVESSQLLSKSMLKLIVKGTSALPLRVIDRVEMDCYKARGKIQIFLDAPGYGQDIGALPADYEDPLHDGDDTKTMLHLQHACVKRFSVGIHGSRFLNRWTAQPSTDFVVLNIDINLAVEPDYSYLDPIVNLIKPLAMEVVRKRPGSGNNHDIERLQMLERDAFLNNLQTIRVVIWFDAFPPTSFVLDEPGYAHYEFKCCYGRKAPDAIDALVEDFKRKGCTNKKLESFSMRWDDIDDQQSPAPKLLNEPATTNERLPKSEMVLRGVPDGFRITSREFHSFVSKALPKQMEVYKWIIEYDNGRTQNRAHILQCRLK